jgi:hypothetical protein
MIKQMELSGLAFFPVVAISTNLSTIYRYKVNKNKCNLQMNLRKKKN